MAQVFKFEAGKKQPSLTLGKAFQPATSNEDVERFCKPTDVAVASNGDFFVSDGWVLTHSLTHSLTQLLTYLLTNLHWLIWVMITYNTRSYQRYPYEHVVVSNGDVFVSDGWICLLTYLLS